MLCLFVKWSWVPSKLTLYCVSPSKWFAITSNSICKKCNHHFFFHSRSSFFPWFLCLLMASAAFSQSPSLETLSHLLFAPPSISVSAIALIFMFPPFHLHCQHLSVGPFNDYQNKSVNSLQFSLYKLVYPKSWNFLNHISDIPQAYCNPTCNWKL